MTTEINIEDVEIEYHGLVESIGTMMEKLKDRRASYWHWHTLLEKTKSLYNEVKKTEDYGILLQETLTINGEDSFLLEAKIANGVYNEERLFKLVRIYAYLLHKKEHPDFLNRFF